MANTNIGTPQALTTALEIYKSMIGTKTFKEESDVMKAGQADKIPMALLGLALNLEKFCRYVHNSLVTKLFINNIFKIFRFKLGLKVVERGIDVISRKKDLPQYTWPGTEDELIYCKLSYLQVRSLYSLNILTNVDLFQEQFEFLKDKFSFPPPAKQCRYPDCLSHQTIPSTDIYVE